MTTLLRLRRLASSLLELSTARTLRTAAAAVGIALLAAGCGGGGGGGGGTATRQPLATLSQDILPSGTRIDRRASNYFPAALGDRWEYERRENNAPRGVVTRVVTQATGSDFLVSETGPDGPDQTTYRRTAEGLVVVDPLAGFDLPAVRQVLPTLLEYPEPFYPVGSTRQVIRQGSLGDLDGDGTADSYRFEYRQTLVGFGSVTLGAGLIDDTVQFRNVITVTVQPSDPKSPVVTVVATEENWFAPEIGLVRATLSIADGNGTPLEPTVTLFLTSATINGAPVQLANRPDGTVRKLALTHVALVYDAPRNRYLASVPASVLAPETGLAQRIAAIDPTTGTITVSREIGGDPGPLALAADGGALYVGLNATSELVKLRLPDFAEQWRVRMPVQGVFGQTTIENIAVSPVDPDVVAVSLYRGVSPRHAGVALVRGGVLQPRLTPDHTGSNVVVFDADGARVYGYNTETTDFGLRRMVVRSDGLEVDGVVTVPEAGGALVGAIDRLPGSGPAGVLFGRAAYATPALTSLGTTANSNAQRCRAHAASGRIVCLGDGGTRPSIYIVDRTTLGTLAAPVYSRDDTLSVPAQDVVPGPSNQVALRLEGAPTSGPFGLPQPMRALWLFTPTQFP